MDNLLNTKEAAEILGVGVRRIGVLCREGRFPGARRVGRDWGIPEEDVRAFVPKRPRKRDG
jgi:excisionase family DNA binding protein